jgi:hypothetical protein
VGARRPSRHLSKPRARARRRWHCFALERDRLSVPLAARVWGHSDDLGIRHPSLFCVQTANCHGRDRERDYDFSNPCGRRPAAVG